MNAKTLVVMMLVAMFSTSCYPEPSPVTSECLTERGVLVKFHEGAEARAGCAGVDETLATITQAIEQHLPSFQAERWRERRDHQTIHLYPEPYIPLPLSSYRVGGWTVCANQIHLGSWGDAAKPWNWATDTGLGHESVHVAQGCEAHSPEPTELDLARMDAGKLDIDHANFCGAGGYRVQSEVEGYDYFYDKCESEVRR